MLTAFEVTRGSSPVILAFPHTGTEVPADVSARLNENGRLLADTDWHIHQLYEGVLPNATTVRATFHRYVIDANRDPSGSSLYPGQNTTGLVPLSDFDGQPIWANGGEPTDDDIAYRLGTFHRPYHAALSTEVARVKAEHSAVILYDCHSICSSIPFLFEGRLPDFNIGTNSGASCAKDIETAAVEVVACAAGYTHVLNGRFKGGWTTRHYGQPDSAVHAIQIELAQSTYLTAEVSPFAYDRAKAVRLRVHLKRLLEQLEATASALTR